MNVSYRLVPFGADAPPPVIDLAGLHAALLPDSPIALLGDYFMTQFYYGVLPREGYIFGTAAYVDDHPAGFIVATHDPTGFMRSALRRWWPRLIWIMGTSLLSAPKSITAVWEAGRVMRQRDPIERSITEGEILSLGVVPRYRDLSFIRQFGLHLSNELLDCATAQLRQKGVQVIRATVRADNTPAKLFYSGLGWTLDSTSSPGWRHQTVQFVGHL